MKYAVLTCILFLTLSSINAQDNRILFGLSSSLDYNSYLFVRDNGPYSFEGRANYSGGLVLKYSFNKKWLVTTKALYSSKNFQESIDFAEFTTSDPNDPLLITEKLIIRHKNRYVEIPLELNHILKSNAKKDLILCFGVTNSFLFSYASKTSSDLPVADLQRYNDYILGLKLGFGLVFKLGAYGIHLEPQTKLYITEVHYQYPDQNPVHFGLELQLLKM